MSDEHRRSESSSIDRSTNSNVNCVSVFLLK